MHQQTCIAKFITVVRRNTVVETVISSGNFVRKHGFNHSQLKQVSQEILAKFDDVLYRIEIR
jgi:hypothetical protein